MCSTCNALYCIQSTTRRDNISCIVVSSSCSVADANLVGQGSMFGLKYVATPLPKKRISPRQWRSKIDQTSTNNVPARHINNLTSTILVKRSCAISADRAPRRSNTTRSAHMSSPLELDGLQNELNPKQPGADMNECMVAKSTQELF